jgi:hypothetical protein
VRVADALQAGNSEHSLFDAAVFRLEAAEEGQANGILVIESSRILEKQVEVGTGIEELEFEAAIDLETEQYIITGLAVNWNYNSYPVYDPETCGTYYFFGELEFPEKITSGETVFVIKKVDVAG